MNKRLAYRWDKSSKVIHVLAWIILFCLPILFSLNNPPDTFFRYVGEWLPLVFSAIIFYLNYLILIDRFLFKSNYWLFILLNVLVISATTWLTFEGFQLLGDLFRGNGGDSPPQRRPLLMIFFRISSSQLLTVAVAIAIKSTRRWYETEQRQKQLEQEHLESKLVNLKNQLNPHFFFNTLNNIYSLIPVDQQKAQEVVHHLSKMMRYLLYESNSKFVPLAKEVDFINYYIDLMELRLSDHVKINRSIRVEQPQVQIAPLLFISLVENAFKHGVSATATSEVAISLGATSDGKLEFVIRNTAYPKKEKDLSGSGIGLENLEKRLNLLYPERHLFDYRQDHDYFEATLTLQL